MSARVNCTACSGSFLLSLSSPCPARWGAWQASRPPPYRGRAGRSTRVGERRHQRASSDSGAVVRDVFRLSCALALRQERAWPWVASAPTARDTRSRPEPHTCPKRRCRLVSRKSEPRRLVSQHYHRKSSDTYIEVTRARTTPMICAVAEGSPGGQENPGGPSVSLERRGGRRVPTEESWAHVSAPSSSDEEAFSEYLSRARSWARCWGQTGRGVKQSAFMKMKFRSPVWDKDGTRRMGDTLMGLGGGMGGRRHKQRP